MGSALLDMGVISTISIVTCTSSRMPESGFLFPTTARARQIHDLPFGKTFWIAIFHLILSTIPPRIARRMLPQ